MGYHVGGLITHFFGTRTNNFIEMGLHHVVAIYLFGGCYLFNVWELGTVIAYLHDIADVTTNIIKTLTESSDKKLIGFVFVTHMGVWFWTRLLVLPYLIYNVYFMNPDMGNKIVMPFFCWLLSCMFVLHWFWFMMFVNALQKYLKFGQTEDVHNKQEVVKVD